MARGEPDDGTGDGNRDAKARHDDGGEKGGKTQDTPLGYAGKGEPDGGKKTDGGHTFYIYSI